MVNNSVNINKTGNYLSLQIIEHTKKHDKHWWKSSSCLEHAQQYDKVNRLKLKMSFINNLILKRKYRSKQIVNNPAQIRFHS